MTGLHRFTADEACPNGLDESIAAFFELSATLALTAPEQRALLHISAAELRRVRTRPVAELELDLDKLQRRLDYAIPLMHQMAGPRPS